MKTLCSVFCCSLFFLGMGPVNAPRNDSLGPRSTIHKFVEDNDLWQEDGAFLFGGISREEFDEVIDNAVASYSPVAASQGLSLDIERLWDDSMVNALANKENGSAKIWMFGGLARRPEVTVDAFALVLCHELGHIFAGPPFSERNPNLSAEGMSDYYGAGECMSRVLPTLPLRHSPDVSEFSRSRCPQQFGENTLRNSYCLRQLSAGLSLGALLAVIAKPPVPEPRYETPDRSIVTKTATWYPATVQCRLDTYRAATFEEPKPACWFKD